MKSCYNKRKKKLLKKENFYDFGYKTNFTLSVAIIKRSKSLDPMPR